MAYISTNEYLQLLNELGGYHVPKIIMDSLSGYVESIYKSEIGNRFSAPMLWIGLYIAFASLICTFAMGADLVHGFLSRKIWVPCKYFRINSFYLTVISVAMKLPVDLTTSMPGVVDQATKIGSLAFMCTIMANLLPFLATMDDNDIYSNIAALSVLVITMVVNVCIQIKTGVVSTSTYDEDPRITMLTSAKHHVVSLPKIYSMLPIIYVTLLLVLLILYVCSCLAILSTKKEVESDYQDCHGLATREIQQPTERLLTVEKLQMYVTQHWVMARACSSQFVFTGYFPTTCASGVICVFVAILHLFTMWWTFGGMMANDYDSDYSWSMMVIVVFQLIRVVIGTIAPLCRCFTPIISFKTKILEYFFYDVDAYWFNKLEDWLWARIRLPCPQLEWVIQTLKSIILTLCMHIQFLVLLVCRIISVSFIFLFFFLTSGDGIDSLNVEEKRILKINFVGIGEELELNEGTGEGLLNSVKQLIQEGEKKKPVCIDLLNKATPSFYGVKWLENNSSDVTAYSFLVNSKLKAHQSCWSLQVVTLATIAYSLPEIKNNDWLVRSLREFLVYVMVVDESLNSTSHYILDAVKELWKEVDVYHMWLGNKLPDPSNSQLNTAQQVGEWFKDTARNTSDLASPYDKALLDYNRRRIFIISMYRITLGILDPMIGDDYHEFANQRNLFDCLSLVIADIIAACLTNLPQIIINKCHPSVAEEREASVKGAALLLGQTKQIIEKLQTRSIPHINSSDMPFFDKWRAYLTESHDA